MHQVMKPLCKRPWGHGFFIIFLWPENNSELDSSRDHLQWKVVALSDSLRLRTGTALCKALWTVLKRLLDDRIMSQFFFLRLLHSFSRVCVSSLITPSRLSRRLIFYAIRAICLCFIHPGLFFFFSKDIFVLALHSQTVSYCNNHFFTLDWLTVLTAASLPGGTKPVLIRWYEDVLSRGTDYRLTGALTTLSVRWYNRPGRPEGGWLCLSGPDQRESRGYRRPPLGLLFTSAVHFTFYLPHKTVI